MLEDLQSKSDDSKSEKKCKKQRTPKPSHFKVDYTPEGPPSEIPVQDLRSNRHKDLKDGTQEVRLNFDEEEQNEEPPLR